MKDVKIRNYLLPSFLILVDMVEVYLAAILSLYTRGYPTVFDQYLSELVTSAPFLLGSFFIGLCLTRVYSRLWKYAGAKELVAIIGGCLIGISVFSFSMLALEVKLPRTVYFLTFFFAVALISASRYVLKLLIIRSERESIARGDMKRILIAGAGDAGNILAREIETRHAATTKVVGFIDRDKNKKGHYINGIKVYGDRHDIQKICDELHVTDIIVAIPSLSGDEKAKVINDCASTNLPVSVLPEIFSMMDGSKVGLKDLRPINIEDLLQRDSVQLDLAQIGHYLTGKRVLVTGAGGSIGSEICRQVMKMGPARLILLGRGENSIYEIHQELLCDYDKGLLKPVIANITNEALINEVFATYKPQVVFHAAAHKHVPLMEAQPEEAVYNNIFGSWHVGYAAGENGVETFVTISTDKAVNPTSVMGATKRCTEKIMQALNKKYPNTRYAAVRFGNVLGSRGSVVPLFTKQIKKGGPLTVTDPEMKRYFMSIPEASQLVLQAGSMGEGGEVFVLDMGQPVKIVDLARNMIRLSGYEPDVDIKIKFTGLRPGEKLFEELLTAEEGTEVTTHKQIFKAILEDEDVTELKAKLKGLRGEKDTEVIIAKLKEIIPTYHPNHFDA